MRYLLNHDRADMALGFYYGDTTKALLEYRYDEFVDFPMYYEESSNLLEMLDRVNQGKIDAVFDYKADMLAKAAELTQPIQFMIKENVLRLKVFLHLATIKKVRKLKITLILSCRK